MIATTRRQWVATLRRAGHTGKDAQRRETSGGTFFNARDPQSGDKIEDRKFREGTKEDVERIMCTSADAFELLKMKSSEDICSLLRCVAEGLEKLGEDFVHLAVRETALPHVRINNERARTADQLRQFASLVEEGSWVDAHINYGGGKDLRNMLIPIGPVAVFGASNFPLAFSVAGGDTASALAAKNPVVVKAHPAHPGVSEIVAGVLTNAIEETGMPSGTFQLIQSTSPDIGQALVKHPYTAAVGFTGSLRAGRALMDAAAARTRPIPVYAEMGSINPIFIMPSALETRWEAIASGLCGSVTLGSGQFCTNPGLCVGVADDRFDRFAEHLARAADQIPVGTMLTHGIRDQYRAAVEAVSENPDVETLTTKSFETCDGSDAALAPAVVMRVSAAAWLENIRSAGATLSEEMFGPATLLVACADEVEMLRVARELDGQLTGSIFGFAADANTRSSEIVRALQDRVGRLVFNDFPTGVDVCSAMMHGGPYPAASTSHHTSVGTTSIRRFARPLCFQDFPEVALPAELQDANPLGIMRTVNSSVTCVPIESGSYAKRN